MSVSSSPSLLRPVLATLVAAAACRPDIPDPVWKGKHLHYGTTTSDPICGGSFHRQEQHAVEMARLLGIELSEVIRYTRVSPSEIGDYCFDLTDDGCAYVDDGQKLAFSVRSFSFHEIAHSVADIGGFRGAQAFAEGYAQVFDDGGYPGRERLPIADVLENFVRDVAHYYTVGLFARFLIERHGLERYVEFLRATDWDDDFARMSAAYSDVFDEPLDIAMTEFEAYPSCSEISNRLAVVDCNLPLEPWDQGEIDIAATVDCSRDDVLGPTDDGLAFTTRAFEVEKAGEHFIWAFGPDEGVSFFRLVKCGSCLDSFDAAFVNDDVAWPYLTPGRYYLLLGRRVDEPGEISLFIGAP